MRSKYANKDLEARLHGTIIRYNNHPYFCRYNGSNSLILYHVNQTDSEFKTIKGNDVLLDISSVPLGYIQQGDKVAYLTRKPHRRYKQGIDDSALLWHTIDEEEGPQNFPRSLRGNLYTQATIDMILGNYPALDKVMDIKPDRAVEVAISRDVAVRYRPALQMWDVFLRRRCVGWVPPGTRTVVVPSNDMGWVVSLYLTGFNWEVK